MKKSLIGLAFFLFAATHLPAPIIPNRFDTNADGASVNGSTLTSLSASAISSGTVAVANGGTGGTNQTSAQANIESPLYVRAAGPPVASASYTLDVARTNEGMLIEYSTDLQTWQALSPNGAYQFTNYPGIHDPGFYVGSNGMFYVPFTYQSQSVFSLATNFGLISSPDFINWSLVGTGAIPFNTNQAQGISWAPDLLVVNGKLLLYGTQWNDSGFDGTIRALTAQDATLTNWTTPAGAILLITNEAATTTGSPYGNDNGSGPDGVNDSFGFNVNTNTWLTNSSGGSVLLPGGTYLHIAYNWATLQYDGYTNAQSLMPVRLHLALTNLTALTNATVGGGSEGGMFIQLQNGNYRFYGSVGIGARKGQYFYSDNTNGMIGGWTSYNMCSEFPRYNFGQSTVVPLVGTNKLILQRAIANASQTTTINAYAGASAAYSIRQLPGYSGPAMDVRRSADNLVTRINFTATGDLDTNTLASFAGSGNALVTCWYDQSGNKNNLVQATSASQPTIVSNGTLMLDQNGYTMLKFGGNPTNMESSHIVNVTGGFSAFSYAARNWATANYSCAVESADYTSVSGWGFTYSTGGAANGWSSKSILANSSGFVPQGNKSAYAFGLPSAAFLNSTNNGTGYVIDVNAGSTNSGVWINGTPAATSISNTYAVSSQTNIFVGGNTVSGDYNDGYISEMVLFPSAQLPAVQLSVRQNMLAYYSPNTSLTASNLNTLFGVSATILNTTTVSNLNATNIAVVPNGNITIIAGGSGNFSGNGNNLINIPSSSIIGTIASNNAAAGSVGEFVQTLVGQGSAVTCTTGVITNVAQIILLAGDWDVEGNVNFTNAAATVTQEVAGIWPTTLSAAGMPTDGSEVISGVLSTVVTGADSITLPRKRIDTSVTTTNFLAAKSTFSAGTVKAYGQISARRVR